MNQAMNRSMNQSMNNAAKPTPLHRPQATRLYEILEASRVFHVQLLAGVVARREAVRLRGRGCCCCSSCCCDFALAPVVCWSLGVVVVVVVVVVLAARACLESRVHRGTNWFGVRVVLSARL